MKKAFIAFLSLALVATISSCSKDDDNNSNNGGNNLTTQQKLIQWGPWKSTPNSTTGVYSIYTFTTTAMRWQLYYSDGSEYLGLQSQGYSLSGDTIVPVNSSSFEKVITTLTETQLQWIEPDNSSSGTSSFTAYH